MTKLPSRELLDGTKVPETTTGEFRLAMGNLRQYLADYLENRTLRRAQARQDLVDAISELHTQYMSTVTDMRRDVQFILRATELLMAGCLPAAA